MKDRCQNASTYFADTRMRPFWRLAFLISLLVATATADQTGDRKPSTSQMPPSAYKLIAVKVKGSKRYTDEEVIQASGLRMAANVGDDDFRRAARELSDSGAFTDVAYSFSYSPAGTKLEFQIVDTPQFFPVRFDDFVWFSDDQLLQQIRQRIPLFKGELPNSGRLSEQVSDVLQALLVERNVPGHVEYVRNGRPDGKLESISYSVADVLIRVRKIEFVGANSHESPQLEAAAKRLPDEEYSRSRMNRFVEAQFLPVYQAHGYLKASFSQPELAVVKQSHSDASDDQRNLTLIDVTLRVDPGTQYSFGRLEWSGNEQFSTEMLQAFVHAQLGKSANLVQLTRDVDDVKKLYGSHGYLSATITLKPQLDEAAHTADYTLAVQENYVYRMGDLEFRGIDNTLAGKLRAAWKIRQGDVYDATYLQEFLIQANKLLPANFDWGVETHVTPNSHDKSVDVEIHYTVKATS